MQKALLIAEKPSLLRTIQAVYKKNQAQIPYSITFKCQSGHLFQLKKPDEMDESMKEWKWENLPFYPDEKCGWKYKIAKSTDPQYDNKKTYKDIEDTYKNGGFDFIIHAGDPDREGELLIWETLAALKNNLPVKRYWSNDTTDEAVFNALLNLRDEATDVFLQNLKEESYGRRDADYIVGNNGSRAGTLQMSGRASLGRVKTPIMGMVCLREIQIQNFKPTTSYGVRANYTEGFTGQYFIKQEAKEQKGDSEEGEDAEENTGVIYFDTKQEAQEFIKSLDTKAVITSFETKRSKTTAPKLFKLATAQVEAGKYGYSAETTLSIIQGLYEKSYISYPRTDCECISSNENLEKMLQSVTADDKLTSFIKTIDSVAIQRVKKTKKYVNDNELLKHGHSGLTPTTNKPNWDSLSKDEKFIYDMIARRFVAIFLPPVLQDKTSLVAEINGNTFKSSGKFLVDAGYSKIFNTTFSDVEIPPHNQGDVIDVKNFEINESKTQCPQRFTSSTLIAACENPKKYLEDEKLKDSVAKDFHIGTPATRADIIYNLQHTDGYLKELKQGKKIYLTPTENGMKIYQNLKDTIICKVDMTADWDLLLESIGRGEITRETFESKVKRDLEKLLDEIKNTKMEALSGYETVGKCPKCKGDILSGKKGFFCKNWKKDGSGCDFSVYGYVCETKLTDNDFKKLLSGETIKKKIKNKGKSWDQELIFNFDEYKVDWVKANADFVEENTNIACPLCGKDIVTTPWGFKCTAYEKDNPTACKFSVGEVCGVKLSVDDLADLVINKKTRLIDGFYSSKSKKKFSAYLCLNEDKGLKFEFPTGEENTSSVITECPKCGASMVSSRFDYHCSNEACDIKLSKYVAKKWIPDSEIEKIFKTGKSSLIKGLQGKSKKFDAYLKWDGGSNYEFVFSQKKKGGRYK